MAYHFSKILEMPFDAAVTTTTEVLKQHGFGVLTEIDVQATMDGKVEVSAVDPVASMQAIDNPGLADTAAKVREMLRRVVDQLGSETGAAAGKR